MARLDTIANIRPFERHKVIIEVDRDYTDRFTDICLQVAICAEAFSAEVTRPEDDRFVLHVELSKNTSANELKDALDIFKAENVVLGGGPKFGNRGI